MSKFQKYVPKLTLFLVTALVITIPGFCDQRGNSSTASTSKSLLTGPYHTKALPRGVTSFPQAPPAPPPVAYFSSASKSAYVGMWVSFDASFSSGTFGQITSYEWDFGDKSDGEGKIVTHSYSSAGDYKVTLKVRNSLEMTATFSRPMTVSEVVRGDVNKDSRIDSNDAALALRIATGLTVPTNYQKWAADANGDSEIGSDDVVLILRKATGLAAPVASAVTGAGEQPTVTLTDAHGVAGENISVPLEIYNGDSVSGGRISVAYDPEVLRAVGVSSRLKLLMSNIADPGVVNVAFASAGKLEGQTVATLEFSILADAASPLRLPQVELYNSDALPLDPRSMDRKFVSWATPAEQNALLQNFPNPFNPETWIPYQLREDSKVTIRIYSAAGSLVRQLDMGHKPAGLYLTRDRAVYWDGKDSSGEIVASGVYFYSIRSGDFGAVKKLTVVR